MAGSFGGLSFVGMYSAGLLLWLLVVGCLLVDAIGRARSGVGSLLLRVEHRGMYRRQVLTVKPTG